VSLVNLSKFILYKREINRTVLCEFSESVKVHTVQKEINGTVLCEFSESIEVDTVQKRDK
jgi:hypothetical protein